MKRGHAEFVLVGLVFVIAVFGFVSMIKLGAMTGAMQVPQAKSYGGAIRGISDTGSRAFAGRAFELPEQNCYTCDCLSAPLTSVDEETAAIVCRDNCGGTIVDSFVGPCR